METIIFVIAVALLLLSGFFNWIQWAFNIPAIIIVFVLWLVAMYNGLVRLRNRAKEAWSDIEVQLKRRYDLIPNLVETVKGYAKHESQAFENVTRARAEALQGGSLHERAEKENMLSGALKSIFAVAEAYPELKANTNFLELQRELSDTENKIQASRRFYNTNVLELNTRIEMFPSNVVAGTFGFKKEEFFDLDETPAQREPVKVSF
ncbi:LemA family protein [Candidatus Giovannonibacteria bacterium]|nr:LemA family protein [Candidatus Giovannonibacteria bacterium]